MRRIAFSLMALIAATAIWAGTAQAAPTVAVTTGLASQTVARHGHGHYRYQRHQGPRHHHGYHWRPRRHIHHPPVYVRPPIYYGYGYGTNGFYYSGPGLSFGFSY